MALVYDKRRKTMISRAPGTKRRNSLLPVEPDNEKLMRSEELDEELLSGIANEITLIHILPKLPWRALLVLSSVCRRWKRALRTGHRYYDERVRSNSTETLAVVDVILPDDDFYAIALYSVRDKRFYYVPPIPCFEGFSPIPCFKGFSPSVQCVAVDCKLYVLGRGKGMYVLDLLGERQWRQCESMGKVRLEFGCGVMDGKIYVFGGCVDGAEVYDPKLNSWSPIAYDGLCRYEHRVTVVGEEFVLHAGMKYDDYWKGLPSLEFYNPVTKDYRVVDRLYYDRFHYERNFQAKDVVSGTQGTFYSISWQDIYAHHIDDGDAVTHLRSLSAKNVLPPHVDNSRVIKPFVVTVVDDELLALVHWIHWGLNGSCLVRSRGYSTEERQISWEKAPCSGKHSSPIINSIKCSIQL